MKITGSGPVQSKTLKKTSSSKGSSGSVFSSQVSGSSDSTPAQSVRGTSGIASVDALLALQGVTDSTDGRSKGLARAEEMLSLLDDIRKGILLGAISMPNLRNLADMARNQKSKTGDDRLNEILADIELRAEVELAKYGE
ncbi:flagellar assembly protein FliX [Kordiimonas pumila]|uniref:Flagellar assembly protein FliX n=1 Tax=Kordiimonas pumila TaxID=2161677 RepID=A0ABV7D2K8_9PROT|nr:flagellar assembly protein FliX [Kordiimonas pumila]